MQSRGADPSIKSEDYDTYLNPGKKMPVELAIEEDGIRERLQELEAQYSSVSKVKQPHADIGCWWTLYDYGLDSIKKWPTDHKHIYPGTAHNVGISHCLASQTDFLTSSSMACSCTLGRRARSSSIL